MTTDLLGADGYNTQADPTGASDYTDGFGGTSGATPVVSGVVSLMLDANENLGWRDVRDILAYSAKLPVAFDTGKTAVDYDGDRLYLNSTTFGLAGKSADWNGGATHYSREYGYGAVDAYNAVRMSEVWGLFSAPKTSANEASVSTGTIAVDMSTPTEGRNTNDTVLSDFISTPASFKFDVSDAVDVKHLDLTLNFQLTATEDGIDYDLSMFGTKLKLTAPDGTSAYIDTFNKIFGFFSGTISIVEGPQEFTFGMEGFRGVDMRGTWTLQFEQPDDLLRLGGSLTINSLKLDAYGSELTSDDVYTYTNEFFTMAAISGESGRKMLNDTDGGTDWINAAAVSSDIKLSLVAGQSTSFGGEKAFTISRTSNIEGAVTGDGNDTLIGSRFDNYLFGMRGDDTLNGGAGNDFLFGGTGRDKFLFDNKGTSGKDTVLDFTGGDMIATQTALRGASADGKVTVANNAMLLLDGLLTGDTVLLSQNGGAVLQAQGQKNGYFWYSYVSGADLDPNDVIREVSYQPERVAAGEVEAIASSSTSSSSSGAAGVTGPAFVDGAAVHDAFYLYDPMAGSMTSGVLLHA